MMMVAMPAAQVTLETRAFLNVIAEIPSSNTRKQKLISRVA